MFSKLADLLSPSKDKIPCSIDLYWNAFTGTYRKLEGLIENPDMTS